MMTRGTPILVNPHVIIPAVAVSFQQCGIGCTWKLPMTTSTPPAQLSTGNFMPQAKRIETHRNAAQLELRNLQNHLQCILAGSPDFCSSEQHEQPNFSASGNLTSNNCLVTWYFLCIFGYQSTLGMQSLPGPLRLFKRETRNPRTHHWPLASHTCT